MSGVQGYVLGFASLEEAIKNLAACEAKPLTTWKLAAMLKGGRYIPHLAAALDSLVIEGQLGKFQAGFVHYYALPKEALTGKGPGIREIILDSFRALFFTFGCQMIGKVQGIPRDFVNQFAIIEEKIVKKKGEV